MEEIWPYDEAASKYRLPKVSIQAAGKDVLNFLHNFFSMGEL